MFPEGFRHADMEQPEGGAAGEHQAALAEGLAGGFEEIQFLLEPELGEVFVAEVVQGGAYLFQVALDQPLGAGAAVAVQGGVGDIAQIAVQAFMKVKDQFVDVVALAGLADLPQTVTDQLVIVVGRAVDVLPLIGAAEPVVFTAGTAPFVVAAGLSVRFMRFSLADTVFIVVSESSLAGPGPVSRIVRQSHNIAIEQCKYCRYWPESRPRRYWPGVTPVWRLKLRWKQRMSA